MAREKSLRETSLWAILANRHPALWEEIIGPHGLLERVALNPQPLPPKAHMRAMQDDARRSAATDHTVGIRYGMKTAFAVVRLAGSAKMLGIAFEDIPDICPPEPPPWPPLPEPPDPIPWKVALERVPEFYADYALGLAIGLEATAGDWEDLPGADALDRLLESAIGVAPVRG